MVVEIVYNTGQVFGLFAEGLIKGGYWYNFERDYDG